MTNILIILITTILKNTSSYWNVSVRRNFPEYVTTEIHLKTELVIIIGNITERQNMKWKYKTTYTRIKLPIHREIFQIFFPESHRHVPHLSVSGRVSGRVSSLSIKTQQLKVLVSAAIISPYQKYHIFLMLLKKEIMVPFKCFVFTKTHLSLKWVLHWPLGCASEVCDEQLSYFFRHSSLR